MSFGNNVYNTLNGVTQTAWTPELRFGGATTGITYTSRGGNYMRIGNIVFWNFSLVLSSKGSATGSSEIAGFPIAPVSGGGNKALLTEQNNLDLDANFTFAYIDPAPSVTVFKIRQTGPTTATNSADLDDTNFANNTYIQASGYYFV